MNYLSCYDFSKAGLKTKSCCSSCHHDSEDGYSELHYEVPEGQSYFEPKTCAYVCCVAANEIEFSRTNFAKALLAKRKEYRSTSALGEKG